LKVGKERWKLDKLENQSSGRQLRLEAVSKDFSETPLVMIKQLFGLIVDGADIDHDVAGFEYGRVSGAFHLWNPAILMEPDIK
jgi:hypothetical protein